MANNMQNVDFFSTKGDGGSKLIHVVVEGPFTLLTSSLNSYIREIAERKRGFYLHSWFKWVPIQIAILVSQQPCFN